MSIIQIQNLKYRYPDTSHLALDDISFEVEQGEFIGITGQNAAGKSTLCFAIAGLVPHFFHGAYGGQVIIDNMEVRQHTIGQLSTHVGMVFENPFSQITGSKYTVFEEIAFGLENIGLERTEIIERVEESMALLDITDLKNKNPFDVSGGQMQRIAIAGVIAMKPKILILDEPTSQLDPQGSAEVFQVIDNLTKEGITIIMAEHKIDKMAEYANRILLLDEGKVIAYDEPGVVFSREDLHEYGAVAPTITRISHQLGIKNPQTGLYPTTISELKGEVGNRL